MRRKKWHVRSGEGDWKVNIWILIIIRFHILPRRQKYSGYLHVSDTTVVHIWHTVYNQDKVHALLNVHSLFSGSISRFFPS